VLSSPRQQSFVPDGGPAKLTFGLSAPQNVTASFRTAAWLLYSNRAPIVGSEEARLHAGLRPPLKLYVPISGIQLSRRRPRTRAIAEGRNQGNQVNQAKLAIQLCRRQLLPAATSPAPKSMRPYPSHDPAIEFVEECPDVGALVILAPSPQGRIQFPNHFLST